METPTSAPSAAFISLGALPGDTESEGIGISADGVVAVGASFDSSGAPEAFRWTADGGLVGLGFLPNTNGSFARAANSNGSVIVGNSAFMDIDVAFRWTEASGLERLTPEDAEPPAAIATGISADGSVIVGGAGGGFNPEAFRWTADGGLVGLGTLSGIEGSSSADGVSADGEVITGASTDDSGDVIVAFRWTEESGMVALTLLEGAIAGEGFDISADGNTIVGGTTFSDLSFEATIWNSNGAMGLGGLPDFPDTSADATSNDGSIVVGHAKQANGGKEIAFIWDEQNGMRSLLEVLKSEGLENELEGWSLAGARGISDDGRVIVGTGINPDNLKEAFIAILPPP